MTLTTVLLALVPLAMIGGFLTWLMTMGARDQARSDAWAERHLARVPVEAHPPQGQRRHH